MSLRSFIAVAKLKSFTQAATVLQVSQPRLTAQIKKLEDTLRLRLFGTSVRAVTKAAFNTHPLPRWRRT
jgi:DNA-binding transcriptional LysR family regulator